MKYSVCESATEAAHTPTDWAALGARILAAANHAAAVHVSEVARLRARGLHVDEFKSHRYVESSSEPME